MPRKRPLSADEWQTLWQSYYFKGSTMLVLEQLSKKAGVPIEIIKERIMTPTEREEKVRLVKLT